MGKLSAVTLCLSLVVAALPARAFATASLPIYVTPSHLEVGDQTFEANLNGFRAYLETKRASDPRLFAALDPRVEHLESQVAAGEAVAVAGLVIGVASTAYAFLGRKTCPEPGITDPNFAADSAAWGACNQDNDSTSGKFILLGIGAMTLGGIGWWILSPTRADLLDLVNAHNALAPDTMRLQLGYDPTSRLALGGLSMTF
ncbi:MAG TPA: hypothetical protein VFG23_14920 [Polyangia bacterium]|nr:hypothetical protein [Polyangia bacterium]